MSDREADAAPAPGPLGPPPPISRTQSLYLGIACARLNIAEAEVEGWQLIRDPSLFVTKVIVNGESIEVTDEQARRWPEGSPWGDEPLEGEGLWSGQLLETGPPDRGHRRIRLSTVALWLVGWLLVAIVAVGVVAAIRGAWLSAAGAALLLAVCVFSGAMAMRAGPNAPR